MIELCYKQRTHVIQRSVRILLEIRQLKDHTWFRFIDL